MQAHKLGQVSYDLIHLFERVASSGGISAAARELGMTPSTANRRLAALEEALSARLFQRSTRRLKLTEAGSLVLTWAQQAIVAMDETADNLAAITGSPTGRVRIAATHFASNVYLPEVIASFARLYPEMIIEMITTDHLMDLIEHEYDVALHYGVMPDSQNVGIRLTALQRILCASPTYIKEYGAPAKLQDLSRHKCIVHRPSDPVSWTFRKDGQVFHQPVRSRIEVDNSFNLTALARAGGGIAKVARNSIRDDLDSGRLLSILPGYECVDASGDVPSLWLVYPNRQVSHRVRLLIDHLRTSIPEARSRLT